MMSDFAVMTFMYRREISEGKLSHRELLKAIADSGGKGVEAFHQDYLNNPELVVQYRRLMDDLGLCMAAVDVIVNLVYDSRTARSAARDALRRALDVCIELGSGIAHVAGHKLLDGISPGDGRKMIAELLLDQADYAAQNGMVLAIEDFDPSPNLVCRKDDCLEIIGLTGNRVKMVFDTGNFLATSERADENLPDCYEHIVLCHIKDFVSVGDTPGGRRGTHLGQGITPNREVAAMLKERGYQGWVSLESYPQNGAGALETIPREMAVLQNWFC